MLNIRTGKIGSGRGILGWSCVLLWGVLGSAAKSQEVRFNRDIRPILADKCYACHGPDASQRQADLRLDVPEGVTEAGVVVAGAPAESELISRVTAEDSSEAMPPADYPKQLSDAEKQLLVDWVSQGAAWQSHWAYVPPQAHPTPIPKNTEWARNWIDAFVLSQLEEQGLQPAPMAEPHVLMRRLSFDLLGLPPDPGMVAAFVQRPSEQHYEAIVDQLLESPHYGERMAIYWLDLVRYADTVGYHGDQDVSVSPFRDYVIGAFNSNLPFDQFTREQLAGDLLPEPTRDQLVASGYNKLGMMSAEGGVQPEEYLVKYAADRVRTASSVWLGSTLGCAECHDHKFDPFTQLDFYRFASFFADVKERGLYSGANSDGNWGPRVTVPDLELEHLLQPLDAHIADLEAVVARTTPELAESQQAWEKAERRRLRSWRGVSPTRATALHDTRLTISEQGRILAAGKNPANNTYSLELLLDIDNLTGLRIDVLPDESLPKSGPGRADNGNFVLSEVRAELVSVEEEADEATNKLITLRFARAAASFEQSAGNEKVPQEGWTAASVIDGDEHGSTGGWAILPEVGQKHSIWLLPSEPHALAGRKLLLHLDQNHSSPKHTIGHFQVAVSDHPQPFSDELRSLPAEIAKLLRKAPVARGEDESSQLAAYFRRVAPELQPAWEELEKLQQQREELVAKHTRTSLITEAVEPREMRVLPRGNWMDKSGQIVSPSVPHFLPGATQLDEQGSRPTRLDLANWLCSNENPLTARVFVNRLWKLYFGVGLSKSLDDLGSQGEASRYAELLDTLAVEFMQSGWDVKRMVKLLVMSSTYRQSSLMRDELRTLDPYNRWHARQSRFRLDAEMIRDASLSVSGLLVSTVGGRSVKPYQPAGLYRHLNFPAREYQADTGADQYRRGVYTHWQRQFLHPAMQAFDAPPREECTAERPRSNTPLAALVLLNDPSYVEAARRFAERAIEAEQGGARERVNWMFNAAINRPATDAEATVLLELFQAELRHYERELESASDLLSIGLSEPPAAMDTAQLAAWTAVSRAIFNMHEFVTRN